MDKYITKIVQELIEQKEEEITQLKIAREFVMAHQELDSVSLMKAVDPTLGLQELEVKIKALELFLEFLHQL